MIGDATSSPKAGLPALPWLLLIFVTFYLGKLTTFHIGVDAETAAFRAIDPQVVAHGPLIWLRQGRWGVFLLERYVVQQTTLPFLPWASFGLFMSLAYLMFLRAFGVSRPDGRHCLAFAVFAGFPIWFFLAEFSANIIWAGLGVACCGGAVLAQAAVLRTGGHVRWLMLRAVQAVCIAAAVSIYQSELGLVASAGLGVIVLFAVKAAMRPAAIFRAVLAWAAILVVGLVVYGVVWRIFLSVLHTTPDYIDGFISPEALLADPVEVLGKVLVEMRGVYGGGGSVYGAPARGVLLILALGPLCVVMAPGLRGRLAQQAMLVGLVLAILAVPFAPNLLSGGEMPYRSLVGVPIALWTMVMLALESDRIWLRRAAMGATVLVGLHSLHTAALFHAADVTAARVDERLAAAVYDDVIRARLAAGDRGHSKTAFFGAPADVRMPYPRIETVGALVFRWDGGSSRRIALLMKALGYAEIDPVSRVEWLDLQEAFAAMPIWPAAGSVRVMGEITLVRLGREPEYPNMLMREP